MTLESGFGVDEFLVGDVLKFCFFFEQRLFLHIGFLLQKLVHRAVFVAKSSFCRGEGISQPLLDGAYVLPILGRVEEMSDRVFSKNILGMILVVVCQPRRKFSIPLVYRVVLFFFLCFGCRFFTPDLIE